jgi:hypothetical protein
MDSTISLEIITEAFYRKQIKMHLKGFNFTFNKKTYLITVHHNLPIKTVKSNDIELNIHINSGWNEILILEPSTNLLCKNNNYVHILNKTDIIYITKDDYKIMFSNISYEFIEFDNLYSSPRVPYITADIINLGLEYNLSGLSGSPVYKDNKIVGIFSRYNIIKNKIYIIPIYLVIKTLSKEYNNILNIPNKILKKINYYNVKNGYIFYKPFNIRIPLDTYYLLENNNSQKCILNDGETIDYNNTFDIIINKPQLEKHDDKYKLSYRLFSLLNKLIPDKSKLIKLLDLYVEDNDIYIDNDLAITHISFD